MRKASGKSFRKGISLIELFHMFPDDATAEHWFEAQRWGKDGKPDHCPLCGSVEKSMPAKNREPLP